ncbi:hypothetical protein GJ496_005907 [Pomphorhynchus laevis]|nr:hypothetical protein GJ496_005907 [Pomphorhynchus laevis]
MSSLNVPKNLIHLKNYLRLAEDHDSRDMIVAYQARLYTVQNGMGVENKSLEDRKFLADILDRLENEKVTLNDNEIFGNELATRQYIEQYTLKLFLHADDQCKAGRCDRSLVRMFFTVGLLFDICESINSLDDQISQLRKVARSKAAQLHSLIQSGGAISLETGATKPLTTINPAEIKSQHQLPSFEQFKQQYNDQQNHTNNFTSAFQQSSVLPNIGSVKSPKIGFLANETDNTQYSSLKEIDEEQKAEVIQKGEKFCKFAISALQYMDVKSACENLEKALEILYPLQ